MEFSYSIYYVVLLVISIFLSKFLFVRYLGFAKRYKLTKSTNSRTAHKGLVFTGSGVVYASVIMVTALVLDDLDFVEFSNFSPVIATSILISIVGFYDDFTDISAFHKYIILGFLILMLLYSNATIPVIENLNGFLGFYNIGFIPGLIFTSFVFLSIINSINLIDGIDGYLSIFSIFLFTGFTIINHINEFYTLSSVSVVLIGSCIIFLRYNFSRQEKLFTGDAGSIFLGFWISTFLVIYITSSSYSSIVDTFSIRLENIPVIAISLISIPVLDTIRVMFVRIIKKKSPFSADRNHLHHILIDSGKSHLRTSFILTFINFLNCVLIFLVEQNFNSKELTLIFIGINIFWYVFFELINKKNTNPWLKKESEFFYPGGF